MFTRQGHLQGEAASFPLPGERCAGARLFKLSSAGLTLALVLSHSYPRLGDTSSLLWSVLRELGRFLTEEPAPFLIQRAAVQHQDCRMQRTDVPGDVSVSGSVAGASSG